jgi:hypothetical protein
MKDTQTLRTQYKVGDFVAWQRDGALLLNPFFQRRPVWSAKAKSFLIDTILRGMPMPIIFLRDTRSDVRDLRAIKDVVDGQQRLRTILSFVSPTLLEDFKPERDGFTIDKAHSEELAGKSFDQLPMELRQRVLDYQFSVHIFSADTANSDILQIFARMNATGVKVNAQELRNAEFIGDFKTAAYELAAEQLDRWISWKIFTPNQIARMDEVELTSEFMLLVMDGVLSKRKDVIDRFYKVYDNTFPDVKEVSRRIQGTLDRIESLFPKEVIVKLFSNRSTFFALFAIIYGSQYALRNPSPIAKLAQRAPLKKERAAPLKAGLAEQLKQAALALKEQTAPADVLKVARGAVTDAGARRKVIGYLAGDGNNPCPPQP